MIVELEDIRVAGSFWLHGGGGSGEGHRNRMEDRKDQKICAPLAKDGS